MANAQHDDNHIPTLLGVSSADSTTPLLVKIDPNTGRVLVNSASGSGDVIGPGSSTDRAVVRWDGTSGTDVLDSGIILTDTNVLRPATNDGGALGAATLSWSDLFLASGAVINFNNGNITITHSASALAFAGGTYNFAGGITGTTSITLGAAAGTTGSVIFKGTTSGTVTLSVADAAGTWTLKLPTTDGNNGEFLQTDGSGNTTWAAGSSGITIGTTTITSGTDTRILYDNAGVVGEYTITGTGTVVVMATNPTLSGFTMADATNIVINTTTGTKIGTASTQKIGFFNATPIVQPTGDIVTAMQNLGLGASLTVSGATTITVADEATYTTCFPVFVTAATGTLGPKTNANLTFNSNTGLLGAAAVAVTGSTAAGNSMYLPTANTLGWTINGTEELRLTGTALSPGADGGNSLGTTALGWQNLFGNTGFVLNIENGDWVATHTAGILTVGTGDLRVTTAGTNTASVVTVGGTQTLTSKTLTSPTITTASLSGTQLLAEGASIGLDPAGSADGAYSGITITATAGYSQAFGDLVYLAVADSRWELADADAAATAGPVALAMVVVAGTDGNACTLLLQGTIRADAKFPTMTVGATQYVGETAGAIQGSIPTGADNIIRTVGYALTADELYFNPSTDWQVTVA